MSQHGKSNNEPPPDENCEIEKKQSSRSKQEPRINDQTESTMNIKSYSGFESLKDSIKRQSLISPGVEIHDIEIPLLDENLHDTPVQFDNPAGPGGDDDFEFEKEYYETKEELQLQLQNENENQLFDQSHNSTMLMESVKDNQISHIWGSFN